MEKSAVSRYKITFFTLYPFKKGEKINIVDGPRKGDWEVIDVGKNRVILRCPVTGKELKCDRFCYFKEEKFTDKWPTH